MIYKLLLGTFSVLSLATCQNQTMTEKNLNPSTEAANSAPVTPAQPKTGEPEMSVGLPPDRAAVELSKHEQAQATNKTAGIIYFREGENKFLKEYEMNVTFKRMVEDSRCPQGVNCVWEGVAVAEVELMGLATRPATVKLSTISDAKKGYTKIQIFNGHSISLVEVRPNITSDKGFKSNTGKYQIGLKISRGSSGASSDQRTTTK